MEYPFTIHDSKQENAREILFETLYIVDGAIRGIHTKAPLYNLERSRRLLVLHTKNIQFRELQECNLLESEFPLLIPNGNNGNI